MLIAQARASDPGLLDFLVLCIAAEGDGVVPGGVGRRLSLGTSTMTGLAERLERDRLIRRVAHPKDRRLVLLPATAKGRRLTNKALAPVLGDLTALAEQLSGSERTASGRFLNHAADPVAALQPRRSSFRARQDGARRLR